MPSTIAQLEKDMPSLAPQPVPDCATTVEDLEAAAALVCLKRCPVEAEKKKRPFRVRRIVHGASRAADKEAADILASMRHDSRLPENVVRGYRGDFVFETTTVQKTIRAGNGRKQRVKVPTVIRYQTKSWQPDPPLQDWEGAGMLMGGEADPDFEWQPAGDRARWKDVSGRAVARTLLVDAHIAEGRRP